MTSWLGQFNPLKTALKSRFYSQLFKCLLDFEFDQQIAEKYLETPNPHSLLEDVWWNYYCMDWQMSTNSTQITVWKTSLTSFKSVKDGWTTSFSIKTLLWCKLINIIVKLMSRFKKCWPLISHLSVGVFLQGTDWD